MFAVIRVHQDYDYVEGLEFIASFTTEEKAQSYIEQKNEAYRVSFLQRKHYIEKYVDAMEVPVFINCNPESFKEWNDFIIEMYNCGNGYKPSHVNGLNFKEQFKEHLIRIYSQRI